MTNDEGNVVKTSPYSHTPLWRTSFKGEMWRVIYWVSPRTPEGGQAGKEDKPPLLYILRSRGAHTQLLLATFKEGELVTEKGRKIRELAN